MKKPKAPEFLKRSAPGRLLVRAVRVCLDGIRIGWAAVIRSLLRPFRCCGLPVGFYLEADRLRSKAAGAEGRIELETQGAPTVSSESLLVISGREQHNFQPFPIFWSRIRNAMLVSEGLALIDSRKRLASESVYGPKIRKYDPAWYFPLGAKPLELSGPWTSIVSQFVPTCYPTNYAHWFTDALPRLALLGEFPAETKILVPAKLQAFQTKTLEWMGLMDRCRPTIESTVRIEDYYLSSPVAVVLSWNPYGVHFVRDRLLRFAAQKDDYPRRFYVRRKGAQRNVVNEDELLAFFQSKGWGIIDAGDYPLEEQMALFQNAEQIAGIHGAGLTNILWARPGCKVLEFVPANYKNSVFEWVSIVNLLDYRFLICPSNHLLSATVPIEKVRAILREWGN